MITWSAKTWYYRSLLCLRFKVALRSFSFNMVLQPLAKPPEPLCLKVRMLWGDNWKQFKRDLTYYKIAAKINKKVLWELHISWMQLVKGAKICLKLSPWRKLATTISWKISKKLKQGTALSQMWYMRDTCLTSKPKSRKNRWITTWLISWSRLICVKYCIPKVELIWDWLVSGIKDNKIRERERSNPDKSYWTVED